ncbi:MAG: hypothetical protein KGJ23_13255 [Euryarchaeota archaeon]|nr:hypothetical protein [Euryarchaeota archaeon]MDE1837566.1 hypothetical protein [Euryarchaeota archaeon]MDE1880047.1 hypothetical protein [Euryarchaeota archaeon]MDE2046124.1 hypothetical protein [Thermoplasmata archaeon]
MRLDIGSDGKIIGTRRVSPNGQVSGLSEFAGREVLVILPGSSDAPSSATWGTPEGLTQLVSEQIRQAYQRYQALQEMYATPWEATRSFMQSVLGGQPPDLLAEVDRWVKAQVRDAQPGRTSQPTGSSDDGASSSARGGAKSAARRSDAPGRKRP